MLVIITHHGVNRNWFKEPPSCNASAKTIFIPMLFAILAQAQIEVVVHPATIASREICIIARCNDADC